LLPMNRRERTSLLVSVKRGGDGRSAQSPQHIDGRQPPSRTPMHVRIRPITNPGDLAVSHIDCKRQLVHGRTYRQATVSAQVTAPFPLLRVPAHVTRLPQPM
jgi:hypothetical protein